MDNFMTGEVRWIHVLLKGEASGANQFDSNDDYVREFEASNLTAVSVPILEFGYKNLDKLLDAFKRHEQKPNEELGLIVTSPRVVKSITEAFKQIEPELQQSTLDRLNKNLVFAIGERSASELESHLGLACNQESTSSGSGDKLAEYVKSYCSSCPNFVTLIYPKSSLADTTIENALTDLENVKLEPVIVYETKSIQGVDAAIAQRLSNLKDTKPQSCRLIIDFIFFSPSGVDGFFRMNMVEFAQKLQEIFAIPSEQIEFKYSAIGKTTERALVDSSQDVFAVSSRPNAKSLVDSLIKKW